MSEREKCFSRPKVRFSKSAESPQIASSDRAFGKPIIRSVTNFRPRVKILKAPLANSEFEQSSSPDEITSRFCAGDSPNDSRLCPSKSSRLSAPCLSEIVLSPEGRVSNNRVSSDERKNRKTIAVPADSKKTLKSILVDEKSSSSSSSLLSKNVRASERKISKKSFASLNDEISKPSNDEKAAASSSSRTKNAGTGKENVPSRESGENVVFKVPDNTPRTKSDLSAMKSTISSNEPMKIAEKSMKSGVTKSTAESTIKKSTEVKKIVKPRSELGATRKHAETTSQTNMDGKRRTTSRPIGMMACMKFGKIGNKNEVSMKKTILRDSSAVPSRVYVGPGLPRSRSTEMRTLFNNEKSSSSRSIIQSGDKLARPEYNSIVCTMKKLRDAREDKIVKDVEHLPAIYRRLVNGKVSSALDFGANEAIYRDLIDLSIDEKQLPSRLTRSKDPEPRQRDIAPKLVDFFVPTNDEEYRRAVLVRPPSPRVLDTWNPYKISDRIFSWKDSLDHDF